MGNHGKLALSGILEQGRGQLEYEINGVGLTEIAAVRRLFKGSLQAGIIHGYGQLSVPEFRAVGELVVEDLFAEYEKGMLNFSRLTVPLLSLQLEAPYFGGEEMSLSGFTISLRDEGMDLTDIAAAQQSWSDYLSNFNLGKIYFQNGRMVGAGAVLTPDYQPEFSALHGVIDGISGDPWQVEIGGMIDTGRFQLGGLLSEGKLSAEIEIDRPVLSASESGFLTKRGLKGGSISFHLHQSYRVAGKNGEDGGDIKNMEELPRLVFCRLDNLFPLSVSDFSFMLAMLTDKSGTLELQFIDDSSRFLFESLLVELQRLREQVMLDTVFAVEFPLLNLPVSHIFSTGQAENDNLFLLDDYAELLAMRPRLTLILTGGVDAEADGEALRIILQEEADARREAESLKRQLLRQQLMAGREREEGSVLIGDGEVVIDEDLQPIPETVVDVPGRLLHNLALKRRNLVWDYLVNERGVATGQLILADVYKMGLTGVYFQVTPKSCNW